MKLLGERNWYLPSWLNWLPNAGTHEPKFAPVPVAVPAGD
jgi:RND superfamily putative drug exporter